MKRNGKADNLCLIIGKYCYSQTKAAAADITFINNNQKLYIYVGTRILPVPFLPLMECTVQNGRHFFFSTFSNDGNSIFVLTKQSGTKSTGNQFNLEAMVNTTNESLELELKVV